ncbi:MAG TPA: radical SAM protein [Terriglobales bacterium]|nr:radical SAM protein [Terriglobales bacterium]
MIADTIRQAPEREPGARAWPYLLPSWARIARGILLRRPIFAILRPTARCNLGCTYCKVPSATRGPELEVETLHKIMLRLRSLGVGILNIGGGEPTLRNDIEHIVAAATPHFTTRMQTNGVGLSEDRIRAIVKAGLHGVSVSLDTLDAERFDELCAVQGSWEGAVRTMLAFGRHMPRRGPLLILNVVVSKMNHRELPAMARFAAALGFRAAFVPMLSAVDIDAEKKSYFRRSVPQLLPSGEERAALKNSYAQVIAAAKSGLPIANSLQFLNDCIRYVDVGKRGWTCEAGSLFIVVARDGKVGLCSEIPPEDNILEDEAFEELRSGRWAREREDAVLNCPDCMHPCFSEVSLLRHDPQVFFGKVRTEVQLHARRRREAPTYDEAVALARKLSAEVAS